MDSFEWNKIAGAVLFALLVAVGLGILSDMLFGTHAPESPAYVIATADEGDATGGEEAEAIPFATLLASADAGAGESVARRCVSCHTLDEGGRNGVGPNLWDVVMHAVGAREGYQYSEGMLAYAADAGDWTYENLDAYLTDPQGAVPGTKMAFAGLKDAEDRADLIVYLRTLSADPAPLPEAEAAAVEGAPAEDMAEEDMAAAEPEEAAASQETMADAPADEQQEMAEEPAPAEQDMAEQDMAEAPAAEEAAEEQETAAEPAAEAQETAEAPATEEPAAEESAAEEPAAEEQDVAAAEAPAAMPEGDVAAGESFARRCVACHTLDAGGANRVGPGLFGIVGRVVASAEGFAYSDAMQEFSEGGTKVWDAEALSAYLADPRGTVPGTKMIFPPVASEEDRANIIAYLATLAE